MSSKHFPTNKKLLLILWQMFCLLFSLMIFTLILENRLPNLLRPVSMALRASFGFAILIAAVVIYGTFRVPGRLGDILGLTATMSLFALGLAGLWVSGNTQSVVLNGVIPLTDAAGYYTDAIRLQYGLSVSNFTAMRPFFAGMLSLFLWASNDNLMIAAGIFTAITGFACYLASREIQRSHGAEVSTFFLILMFLFYRHHSGTTMSETLGLAVSLFGVALLWNGITVRNKWNALFGIGMIALALNVRPGAMFVLPALLLWGGWFFREKRNFSFSFFVTGTIFILLTFFANSRVINFVYDSNGIPFENFAWAFYGLASGGKSWTYVFQANPQLQLLNDHEVTPAIYRLAFEKILSQPNLIIQGAFFYWKMFFSSSWYNAYAFVAGDNYWVNETARWGMYVLGALGISKWMKNRHETHASFAMLTTLGVLASVPFVPPTDAYRVRLYAATIPFFAVLPAMGLFSLLEKVKIQLLHPDQSTRKAAGYPLAAISLVLIFFIISAPIFIKSSRNLPPPPKTACPSEMDSFFTQFNAGTSINLHRENKVFLDWMPDFHMSLFRRNIHSLPDYELIEILNTIEPMNTLFYAVDLQTNRESIVVVKTELLEPGTLIRLCGNLNYDPKVTPYSVFFAETVEVFPKQ